MVVHEIPTTEGRKKQSKKREKSINLWKNSTPTQLRVVHIRRNTMAGKMRRPWSPWWSGSAGSWWLGEATSPLWSVEMRAWWPSKKEVVSSVSPVKRSFTCLTLYGCLEKKFTNKQNMEIHKHNMERLHQSSSSSLGEVWGKTIQCVGIYSAKQNRLEWGPVFWKRNIFSIQLRLEHKICKKSAHCKDKERDHRWNRGRGGSWARFRSCASTYRAGGLSGCGGKRGSGTMLLGPVKKNFTWPHMA